ncbi:hypothetical protein K490DRAFT_72611 [Saccharata proteae CBS 121410]|uniref:VPS9 domain-containing protein n=1 Tax=Saccharata proteae CBS 121410 TaxID=1314787 RepID=A0A6A5YBD2_9PEZI|nr:hypothetical protein K490DRAFT_72611 [Saccharata proteae CBS 121410]
MHPLNPFLRAFFRSTLPAQCSPAHHHVLLVPTTEVLLSSRDRESHALYADLSSSEEFLASHVLRIPGGIPPSSAGKEGTFRENRGKAKQYSTANGRTVIVKDTYVYSNKGFKSLNQAQLLNDIIFYPDTFDAQSWLVYYISRPLIGVFEAISIVPASLTPPESHPARDVGKEASSVMANAPRKKEVKSFAELLNLFPMIARQMQPGMDPTASHSTKVFVESEELDIIQLYDEEDMMRRSLETAVTAAIDLFQMVDKQQLSHLGATTDLTGPIVERMIEKHITEQLHDSVLFPRISSIRRFDDLELESRIKQMVDVDISQVGITIGDGPQGKQELAVRLSRGVEIFKRMSTAGSPQETLEILLATQKLVTMPEAAAMNTSQSRSDGTSQSHPEKQDPMLTINADTLVALLLVVVIRSSVRHLQARLSYMRHFIFIDDVESGEIGYALSTFEAVLSYLTRDSGALRKASRRNKQLWQATKNGDIRGMRSILEPGKYSPEELEAIEDPTPEPESTQNHAPPQNRISWFEPDSPAQPPNGILKEDRGARGTSSQRSQDIEDMLRAGPLAHVFPFQRAPSPPPLERPKIKKRVSMETRSSRSSSSVGSFRSRADTMDSRTSGIEGDTSIDRLSQTQDPNGQSILMMAIEHRQEKAFKYLLSLEDYYPLDLVLADCNNDGTTLLSAAIQQGNRGIMEELLGFIIAHTEDNQSLADYLARQDTQGRCAAHYLFHQPTLIPNIGHLIPWKLKDKNGQTPLFAMCRSYDHQEYRWMVEAAISSATKAQKDGQPLHLDDHVDSKGNTLLHIVNDPHLALKLLYHCDSDANAANDKHFTPLMVASKYGRTDLVRVFFGDPRVDLFMKDARGLTAVELAKDDEVRNRIDDLVLLSSSPMSDGRSTTVVRSYFVEDGTVRMVLKSGAPNGNSAITVTTCRRSLADFENLARWLALENPASWLPPVTGFQSPFLIPSKPSRAVLRDIQLRLDSFLKVLLNHSTFSTHEMVWEFFLVPDIDSSMLAERSKRKAETRIERVKEEFTPILDVREVENFVQHARESVRSVHHSTKSVLRRINKVRSASTDLVDAGLIASTALNTLPFLPQAHKTAVERYMKTLTQMESSPLSGFYYSMLSISTTITAVLTSLSRPGSLIGSMSGAQKAIDRHTLSLRRSDRWPLGLLDETRHRMQRDAADKVDKSAGELETLGKELKHTQQTVASELAAWQEGRVREGRRACKELAKRMVVAERARLESMRRAIRGLGLEASRTS